MYETIRVIIFVLLLFSAALILYKNLSKILGYLKIGKKDDSRFGNVGKRILNVLKIAIGQSKILRDKAAGPVHAGIFWGFLVFLFSASESVFQGFYREFSWEFLGPLYSLITLFTDIFSFIIIVAVITALIRKFVIKVKRLQGDKEEAKDAVIVLSAIFIITLSLLIQNSALIVFHPDEWGLRPLSSLIGIGMGASSAKIIYEICWWIHITTILIFANYLPFSKHFHIYLSIPNVYFSKGGPVNKLGTIDFEEEGAEKFGVVDIDDLTWKNILDSYACTHCGRCTSVCPANITGKVLDPREIIIQTRNRTYEAGPAFQKSIRNKNVTEGVQELTEEEQTILNKKFVGDYQSIEALWQCTTCGACMQECPVTIEHVPAIIGMRRSLVMMEANMPAELQTTFGTLENSSSPWAFSQAERADWAEGLDIRTAADHPDFEYLFWVGCAGSFDDRAKKISTAFTKLLNKAGIDFAILGTEEQCNGDVARRGGNEYLADMMIKMNLETLQRYNVKKILTICPHCFNTFKNEYPDFGGNFEVLHHTQFLKQLIDEGKLKLKGDGKLNVAYHDSCYLGRYNNEYSAPRDSIKSIPGLNIIEPKRTKDKGFCCGAGGAQMFMEETEGKRVNIERTEELLNTGAAEIASNCPFCMTMLTDGVKAKDKEEEVAVKDIAEIILDHLE